MLVPTRARYSCHSLERSELHREGIGVGVASGKKPWYRRIGRREPSFFTLVLVWTIPVSMKGYYYCCRR
uniref:Uncharacterized protein n=1 Tax=Octopus bimaculoides TaxID=37653 RepID=A0A0L8I545_OCTBM